jgi:hypothetical protein
MPQEYFSDRENGPRPRVMEEISLTVWKGLHAVIKKWYNGNAFCGMGLGQDEQFIDLLSAELPTLSWPLSTDIIPSLFDILDLIEFCYKNVACTTKDHYDEYLQHSYQPPDREMGQNSFREDINQIFKRNGIIYELSGDGSIIRLAPEGLRELLQQTVFHTGDPDLDELLNTARIKFLVPDLEVHKESLEKLWGAWERLKTIESNDKKSSITILLKKTSPEQNFCNRLDREAVELTDIGNKFRIRHHEMDRIPIVSSDHVDYLFHRMFSLIYLILKSTNRIK